MTSQTQGIEKESLSCISVQAAGRILGVSKAVAYAMAHSGQMPVIKCGTRRLVVPLPALRRMLEGLEEKDDGLHPNHG